MKKLCLVLIAVLLASALLPGCAWIVAPGHGSSEELVTAAPKVTEASETAEPETTEANDTEGPEAAITAEMAYAGVENYCRSNYDWSIAEENPDIMYVIMGEETEEEYEVVFRSYTGAFVNFHVDKTTGEVRMTEYVPALETETEAGSFDLFDYLDTEN